MRAIVVLAIVLAVASAHLAFDEDAEFDLDTETGGPPSNAKSASAAVAAPVPPKGKKTAPAALASAAVAAAVASSKFKAAPLSTAVGAPTYASIAGGAAQVVQTTRDGQANAGNYVAPMKLSAADAHAVETLRLQWDKLLKGQVQTTVNSKTELAAAQQLNFEQARAHHNAAAQQHGGGGIKWKELVLKIREHETVVTDAFKAFQTAIATTMKVVCNRAPVSCRALGKTDLTSDFDFMIEGGDMQANLNAELTIEWMLTKTFLGDTFFWTTPNTPSFDLKRVFEFFDINFYLENFGLKRAADAPSDLLASYFLSTDFKGQLPYAFMEDKPFAEKTLATFHAKTAALIPLQQQVVAAGAAATPQMINALNNAKSDLTLYQDECYHTQGTLFHVVFQMQAKIFFRDTDQNRDTLYNFYRLSIVENLMMAKAHAGKQKYMFRAVDAMGRIEVISDLVGPSARPLLDLLYSKITPSLREAFRTESAKPDVYAAFEQQIPALLAALRALLA